jgi:hypothetical protein
VLPRSPPPARTNSLHLRDRRIPLPQSPLPPICPSPIDPHLRDWCF